MEQDGEQAQAAPVLRPARPRDRGALHALLRASWLDFWAPHLPPEARARFLETDPVAGFLDAALADLEVAAQGGTIFGVILVEGDWLEDLHVARAAQGRGIGRMLLDRAVALGARRLHVRAFNSQAIGFYEARGWRLAGSFETTEMGVPCRTHEYRLAQD
ncbi:GNAT family N-acetyltransferase [Halovulum dunhuangense]|uniref:GNAT family N-acetyltransferase n=1 Tax=Halovulum dunhuangense TaxID=1505036 RepID=A0A849L1G7_9RHOB|nr:GNAT family N-acetyltransferase [Halovulum dunhuangense]NNU80148.1 GNAT family N-acetyltransferase [Halovulum dunhuangense]